MSSGQEIAPQSCNKTYRYDIEKVPVLQSRECVQVSICYANLDFSGENDENVTLNVCQNSL